MRYAFLLVGLVLAVSTVGPAHAQQEEILGFDSRIVVGADGALTVTETITVRATGADIKRGIYRDFPTIYRNPNGMAHRVSFEVIEVLRDGRTESWTSNSMSNGIRIYMGHKDRMLEPGRYEYSLTYRTDRQIGFFDEHDELYWNVTGNGWSFPILHATAAVILPGDVEPTRTAGYTGIQGQTGQAWTVGRDGMGDLRFTATRRLNPGEGLTIAIAWPKGHVTSPDEAQMLRWWFRDNEPWLIIAAALAAALGYFAVQWLRVGLDPRAGNVIPRFEPPVGISAAAARFVSRMHFDNRIYGVAVVGLATVGQLRIQRKGGTTRLIKRADAPDAKLTPEEDVFLRYLFADSNGVTVSGGSNRDLAQAARTLKRRLELDFEDVYFSQNSSAFSVGVIVSVMAGILVMWASSRAILDGSMWIGAGLVAALAAANLLFRYLLKAPTRKGRELLDELEGFRMYLAAAELDRLKQFNPPERTPEIFERFLPYALAFNLENQWVAQFSGVLAAAAVGGAASSWQPDWMDSDLSGWDWDTAAADIGGFGDSLGGTIASAESPPSSTSALGGSGSDSYSGGGFSGGGFSGGGGGGGGGGGW